ncbi:MAG TPA: phosphoribosylanthranilate isomerase [Spirochaetia bacterium]|nr:phosphoribosylanthranilate isomerase [Spirochaetia bacterium]
MVRVKICGLRTPEEARLATVCGVDAVGLVFAPSRRRLTVDQARAVAAAVGPLVTVVGVFVDRPREEVLTVARAVGLQVLQFSGTEDPAYCRSFDRFPVIKAVPVRDLRFREQALAYQRCTILLETWVPGVAGGSGCSFDWSLAVASELPQPVILAGGLTPENVAEAVRRVGPWAVDVATGVETDGKKDDGKMRAFVANARKAV